MKKIIKVCFGIVMITTSIFSMLYVLGTPVFSDILFGIIGSILIGSIALTILCLWIACMIILFSTVHATITTGKGIGSLFSMLFDKIKNSK